MEVRGTGSDMEIWEQCACCGGEFQFGPHVYNIQNAPGWNVLLCDTCRPPFRLQWEVSPTPRLIAALKAKGITVPLNKNGMLTHP